MDACAFGEVDLFVGEHEVTLRQLVTQEDIQKAFQSITIPQAAVPQNRPIRDFDANEPIAYNPQMPGFDEAAHRLVNEVTPEYDLLRAIRLGGYFNPRIPGQYGMGIYVTPAMALERGTALIVRRVAEALPRDEAVAILHEIGQVLITRLNAPTLRHMNVRGLFIGLEESLPLERLIEIVAQNLVDYGSYLGIANFTVPKCLSENAKHLLRAYIFFISGTEGGWSWGRPGNFNTAAHYACAKHNQEMIQRLYAAGANFHILRNGNGATPNKLRDFPNELHFVDPITNGLVPFTDDR